MRGRGGHDDVHAPRAPWAAQHRGAHYDQQNGERAAGACHHVITRPAPSPSITPRSHCGLLAPTALAPSALHSHYTHVAGSPAPINSTLLSCSLAKLRAHCAGGPALPYPVRDAYAAEVQAALCGVRAAGSTRLAGPRPDPAWHRPATAAPAPGTLPFPSPLDRNPSAARRAAPRPAWPRHGTACPVPPHPTPSRREDDRPQDPRSLDLSLCRCGTVPVTCRLKPALPHITNIELKNEP